MKLLYIGCIYTGFLVILVNAVIPPHILARARINRPPDQEQSSLVRTSLDSEIVTFEPTGVKCCRLGEKAAKKKVSCYIHDPNRKKNMVHKVKSVSSSSSILVGKAEKCGVKYGKPFEKCCTYREEFYRNMHQCKINFSNKEDRQKCKTLVKGKFSWFLLSTRYLVGP